jgi:hypothetical protein
VKIELLSFGFDFFLEDQECSTRLYPVDKLNVKEQGDSFFRYKMRLPCLLLLLGTITTMTASTAIDLKNATNIALSVQLLEISRCYISNSYSTHIPSKPGPKSQYHSSRPSGRTNFSAIQSLQPPPRDPSWHQTSIRCTRQQYSIYRKPML